MSRRKIYLAVTALTGLLAGMAGRAQATIATSISAVLRAAFDIGGGRVGNFWSNGVTGGGDADYGDGIATADLALDYVTEDVSATAPIPEPGSLWRVLGLGQFSMNDI